MYYTFFLVNFYVIKTEVFIPSESLSYITSMKFSYNYTKLVEAKNVSNELLNAQYLLSKKLDPRYKYISLDIFHLELLAMNIIIK